VLEEELGMATVASPDPAAPALAGADLAAIRRRTTRLLFVSQIFGSASTAAALTVATILAAMILGSSTWAGVPNSLRILGAALFSVPLSALMVRAGRRNGLFLGYAVGTVGAAISVLSAVLMDWSLLLIGSVIFGAGYAANLLSRYAAADVSPVHQRGRTISFVLWGATVGAVAGPSIIGFAASSAEGLGLPPIAGAFAVSVPAFTIAALLVVAGLRPDPLQVARRLAAQDPALREQAPPLPLGELLRIGGVQVGLTALMCSNVIMIGIMAMTPVHMHVHGHSLHTVGLVISAHVVGMYVCSPLTGWLTDRLGRHPVIVLSALTFIAAALVNGVTPPDNGFLLGLGMFLIGLGWNFGFVAGSALLTDAVALHERPRVQGIADLWMGVAAALGSLVSGPIMEGYGFPALNYAIGLLVLFPLAVLFLRRATAGYEARGSAS
jgi:MFS family permease